MTSGLKGAPVVPPVRVIMCGWVYLPIRVLVNVFSLVMLSLMYISYFVSLCFVSMMWFQGKHKNFKVLTQQARNWSMQTQVTGLVQVLPHWKLVSNNTGYSKLITADRNSRERSIATQKTGRARWRRMCVSKCFVNIDDLCELEHFPVIVMKIFQIHSQTIEQSVSHQMTIIWNQCPIKMLKQLHKH